MKKLGQPAMNLSGLACIDTGIQCSVSGHGKMFQDFKESGSVTDHTGAGGPLVNSAQSNFEDAPFREVNYADTYANSTSKVQESEFEKLVSLKMSSTIPVARYKHVIF